MGMWSLSGAEAEVRFGMSSATFAWLSKVAKMHLANSGGRAVLILAIHAVLLCFLAFTLSPTIDEPAHLVAGLSHWKFGNFTLYRVNPPLVRLLASIPLLYGEPHVDWSAYTEAPTSRPEFRIGNTFANRNGVRVFWYVTVARLFCIPFSLIGGWICFHWARQLYGPPAGLVAILLWSFCPNILGNGALVTPDVACTSMAACASYCHWSWNRHDTWKNTAILGVVLGIALSAKFTALLLPVAWAGVWFGALVIRNVFRRPSRPGAVVTTRRRVCRLSKVAAAGVISTVLVAATYGFGDTFIRIGDYKFSSAFLSAGSDVAQNRFIGTGLENVPLPLPENFLVGIDIQRREFEVGKTSYLRGERKVGGWWYYYLYALLVKMPLGSLLLIGLTVSCKCLGVLHWRATDVALLAPAVVIVAVVSSQTGFNRYTRYVLPALPYLFVWTSQLTVLMARPQTGNAYVGPLALTTRERVGERAVTSTVVIVLLSWAIASSLAVFPFSLSYFNELAGGPRNGPRHLLDANIDWGQDLLWLKKWYDAHPEARPFLAVRNGPVDPEVAGIRSDLDAPQLLRNSSESSAGQPSIQVSSGWYAVSVNDLFGYGKHSEAYQWLTDMTPHSEVGYSFRVYFVSALEARKINDLAARPHVAAPHEN
jgi:hypothetical protein